jgi:hypothetical protein
MDVAERAAVRAAMLSVYYHSLGTTFELRGAPAILLPPDEDPLSLAAALVVLRSSAERFREAIWTIVRAFPPLRPGQSDDGIARYPDELIGALDDGRREQLGRFDGLRRKYRRQAQLVASALVTHAQPDEEGIEEEWEPAFDHIVQRLRNLRLADGTASSGTTKPTPRARNAFEDFDFAHYLETELPRGQGREYSRRQLNNFEDELGISLEAYMLQFADAVAFANCFPTTGRHEVAVLPASSITTQNSTTLQTQVTVTALVTAESFDSLRIAMDPQCWHYCSDAFIDTGYVAGSHDLTRVKATVGSYVSESRLLEEDVTIAWASDSTRVASFHNILNVQISADEHRQSIDIVFDLNRAISSRILWDERAGGILVDAGYIKARLLRDGVWRITTRKTIRFSDRTPYSGGAGLNDFGQILNYLAPAMLSWWVESEMYSATCVLATERAKRAALPTTLPPEPQEGPAHD